MNVLTMTEALRSDFFTGVPDSLLQPLCSYLMHTYGVGKHHIIAANEGNAVALAAGYHLATGKVPVVYLQNSGLGNIVNPVTSLMNDRVYGIPCVFIVGWRGEPGVPDEPQHAYQGVVTLQLLHDLDIRTVLIRKDTAEEAVLAEMEACRPLLDQGKQIAVVVSKDALEFDGKPAYRNGNAMLREQIIEKIVAASAQDIIVSTTGKASRELFEIRERNGQLHRYDFLTVGSMGHSSSIALQVALEKPERRVWCIDGDGAALMHMGAMAVIGANRPANLVHVLLNNAAHESVGGMPTVAGHVDWPGVAKACGYPHALTVRTERELDEALDCACRAGALFFIEAKTAIGARADLGRPTVTPKDNKLRLMRELNGD